MRVEALHSGTLRILLDHFRDTGRGDRRCPGGQWQCVTSQHSQRSPRARDPGASLGMGGWLGGDSVDGNLVLQVVSVTAEDYHVHLDGPVIVRQHRAHDMENRRTRRQVQRS